LLEEYFMKEPTAGQVIKGTGSLRKLRWALSGAGKSGCVGRRRKGVRKVESRRVQTDRNREQAVSADRKRTEHYQRDDKTLMRPRQIKRRC